MLGVTHGIFKLYAKKAKHNISPAQHPYSTFSKYFLQNTQCDAVILNYISGDPIFHSLSN